MHSARRLEMFARFFLFFFLFGSGEVAPPQRCPSPSAPRHGAVACLRGKRAADCGSSLPAGAVAEFTCREFYELSGGESRLKCGSDGRWSSPAPKCVPDCGRVRGPVSLIANGLAAPRGAFPWHAAIYHLSDGDHEYWCGGSLTSDVAVVTAAHCVWEIPPEKLVLVFGKFYRRYDVAEENTQTRRAKKVEMLSSYQDVAGNYNGDIAVIFLQEPVVVGRFSAPVCVDWEQRLADGQLAEGAFGLALGWGLTEDDAFSDSLRAVRLPVVSDETCIESQEQDFKKFVTYTSFCAGFGNGTGVCNGDSGGGLTFLDDASGRWYLQGLVSVSPRRKGTPYCDLDFYTVFTKVGAFSKWLKTVARSEEKSQREGSPAEGKTWNFHGASRTHRGERGPRIKGAKILFQHSEKMLELAEVARSRRKPNRGGKSGFSSRGPRRPQASPTGGSLNPQTKHP